MLNEKISIADAKKILGLNGQYSVDELKAAYRKASSENHPDKGGSTAKMQQVNAAYETLKGTGGDNSYQGDDDSAASIKATYERFHTEVKKEFEGFNPEPFLKQFETAFGEKLTFAKRIYEAGGVHMDLQFQNASKDIWIKTTVFVSQYEALKFNQMLSNRNDLVYDFLVNTTFFAAGKKQNIQKKSYNRKSDKTVFTDPEILYPMAKLKKGSTNTGGKFTKKDFEITLRTKFKTDSNNRGFYRVHLDKASFGIDRVVFMGKPTWIMGHIYDLKGGDKQKVKLVYLEETLDNMKVLTDFLQKHKTATPAELATAFAKEIKEK